MSRAFLGEHRQIGSVKNSTPTAFSRRRRAGPPHQNLESVLSARSSQAAVLGDHARKCDSGRAVELRAATAVPVNDGALDETAVSMVLSFLMIG